MDGSSSIRVSFPVTTTIGPEVTQFEYQDLIRGGFLFLAQQEELDEDRQSDAGDKEHFHGIPHSGENQPPQSQHSIWKSTKKVRPGGQCCKCRASLPSTLIFLHQLDKVFGRLRCRFRLS
jgi:hypothetical protein